MDEKITILAFAGSLRKNSYNKALLQAAKELTPNLFLPIGHVDFYNVHI